MRRSFAFLLTALVLPSVGYADEAPAAVHEPAPFWRAAANPDVRRVETLLRQGRAQLYPALGLGLLLGSDLSAHRRAAVENALARFERARVLAPQDPEVLYLSGKALSLWERRSPLGRIEKKTRDAVARFEELRRVAPLYEAEDVAFELGVLYTREGEFARAADEYERALALRVEDSSRSVILGNLAEVTMMAGDLERAVDIYERAISEGTADERLLAMWGLAVTLDRLGERGEASEHARRALREDQRPMGVLKQSTVFFVPAYESHYYDGIGALAVAEELASDAGNVEAIVKNASKVLAQSASPASLLALKQVLAALADNGHKELAAPLYPLVDRAVARVEARKKPAEKPSADEASLDTRELRVLIAVVQATRAFSRYLDEGGANGPWAEDAHSHVQELTRLLAPKRNAR